MARRAAIKVLTDAVGASRAVFEVPQLAKLGESTHRTEQGRG
jgi:hypothetical protein